MKRILFGVAAVLAFFALDATASDKQEPIQVVSAYAQDTADEQQPELNIFWWWRWLRDQFGDCTCRRCACGDWLHYHNEDGSTSSLAPLK